jgi:hypothetical protein
MTFEGTHTGTIVYDALSTHGAGARAGPGIVLAGCWAHVFRKFEEAKPDHPEAEQALAWIGALHEIDGRAAGDPAHLAELRRSESVAVLHAVLDSSTGEGSRRTRSASRRWLVPRDSARPSHRQFKHAQKPGRVTVAGHERDDVAPVH